MGLGMSVLPDGLRSTTGLKIMYVISNHTVLNSKKNYICFHGNLIHFLILNRMTSKRKGHGITEIKSVFLWEHEFAIVFVYNLPRLYHLCIDKKVKYNEVK